MPQGISQKDLKPGGLYIAMPDKSLRVATRVDLMTRGYERDDDPAWDLGDALPDGTFEVRVKRMGTPDKKILMIKYSREVIDYGLKEAKNFCEGTTTEKLTIEQIAAFENDGWILEYQGNVGITPDMSDPIGTLDRMERLLAEKLELVRRKRADLIGGISKPAED